MMKKPLVILMLGLLALTKGVDAQIKIWPNGGIAIGDTTDPGGEKTVFADDATFNGDVTFNGTVTGIAFPDTLGGSDNLFDNGTSSYFTGNLGIGITAPTAKLDINNNIAYQMSSLATAINVGMAFRIRGRNTATSTLAISSRDADNYALQVVSDAGTAGHYLLLNPFGGNVGVGTSTPTAAKLQIAASGAAALGIVRSSGQASIKAVTDAYMIIDSNSGYTSLGHYVSDNVNLVYGGGRVGVGTVSPTTGCKLDVYQGWIVARNSAKVYLGDGIRVAGRAELGLFANGTSAVSEIQFGHTDRGSDSNVRWALSDRGVSSGYITFYEGPGSTGSGWAERFTIKAGGNVGIGTIAPSYKLDVAGTGRFTGALHANSTFAVNGDADFYGGAGAANFREGGSNHVYLQFYARSASPTTRSAYLGYPSSGSEDFTMANQISSGDINILPSTSGRVQLGYGGAYKFETTSTGVNISGSVVADGLRTDGSNPSFYSSSSSTTSLTLNVSNASYSSLYYYNEASTMQDIRIGDSSSNKGLYYDASSERIGIKDDTPSYTLDVNGTGRFTGTLYASTLSLSGTMTLTNGLNVSGAGTFNNGLTTYQYLTIYGTFNNMSDATLKTDIKELEVNSLEKITSLQGVTYRFINDEARNTMTGFLAQDVQKVFPELVSELEEGLAIKTLDIIPHLVEAIKEQQAIIENLEARIKKLEEK